MKKINDPFKNDTSDQPKTGEKRKGRSNKLLENRNRCLADRYYYYCHYDEKRYDVVLDKLSNEFFLSRSTIQDLVQDNTPYLNELKLKAPKRAYFSTRWPHLVWD